MKYFQVPYLKNWISHSHIILLICILTICIGCSEGPTSYGSGEVSAHLEDNGFKVSNDLNVSIYYFAVEQEYAARINWAATSRQENQIKASSQKLIQFSNIPDFKKGDKIILYYWATDEPTQEEIQSFVIPTQN